MILPDQENLAYGGVSSENICNQRNYPFSFSSCLTSCCFSSPCLSLNWGQLFLKQHKPVGAGKEAHKYGIIVLLYMAKSCPTI